MSILSFLGTKIVFLIVFLLVLIVFAIILFVIHNRLNKKVIIKEKKYQEQGMLVKQIQDLKTSQKSPEFLLSSINFIARDFFKDTFWINKALDYSEIRDIFQKKNKSHIAYFCSLMLEVLYSGSNVKREEINRLILSLENIIKEERPDLLQIAQTIQLSNLNDLENKKELPFRIPKIYSEEVIKQLSSLDEEQIEKAYKEIQRGYTQAYEIAENNKDKETLKKLEIFRQTIIIKIKEYLSDPSKIINLVQTISSGAKVISNILTIN